MGEQAQRDWQKGLDECTNPEHNHTADASKMVSGPPRIDSKYGIDRYLVIAIKEEAYMDGVDEGIKIGKDVYGKTDWFIETLRVVLLVYVGIVIGINI